MMDAASGCSLYDEFMIGIQACEPTRCRSVEIRIILIIPHSAMRDTRADFVFLKLDKDQIESLPTFSLHQRWA
jgi:hypothetical protein